MPTYVLKISWNSVENLATQDSTTSVNGAPLQDLEVFSLFLSFSIIGIVITLKVRPVWRHLLRILIPSPNINIHTSLEKQNN